MHDDDDFALEYDGQSRRDLEPGRGPLLENASFAALLASFLCAVFPPIALLTIPLGGCILYLARQDFDKICSGTMDPNARVAVQRAIENGRSVVAVSVLILALLGLLLFVILPLIAR